MRSSKQLKEMWFKKEDWKINKWLSKSFKKKKNRMNSSFNKKFFYNIQILYKENLKNYMANFQKNTQDQKDYEAELER